MKLRKIICVIFFFIGVITACKKDKPVVSEVPSIDSVWVSPTTFTEYKDKLTITIKYKDGNGDLGENDPAVSNLFVTDSRNNLTYKFRIKQLAPDNANIIIQGKLDIIMDNVPILNGSTQETVIYSVYLKDRAGNTSNTITTSAVTVKQ